MIYASLLFATIAWAQIPPVQIPSVEIAPGVHMPLVGAGTWLYNDTVAYDSVCNAFKVGYTYIDTAWVYGNERGVGKAIQECWLDKGRKREDLYLMTKINGGLNKSEVFDAHADNLEWLGLDYVDTLLVHFPADWNVSPDRASPARRQEQWQAMEQLVSEGKARTIGISHYCKQHIDDILEIAIIKPVVNQVEWHIGSGDLDDVIEYTRSKGIFFQSFSPLCGPCTYEPQDSLISGDLVTSIGKKYGVSGSQISLKYLVQHAETYTHYGGVIPKSSSIEHMRTNADLFHFTISDEDMATLAAATKPPGTGGDCDVP